MRTVEKWLFPALTALIVAGAAVLPPRISEARDARQFGQVHAEALEADGLPVYEPPTLLDRMALYTGRSSFEHPILSSYYYSDEPTVGELALSVQALLTGAGILPEQIFLEEPFEHAELSRYLLWDPAEGAAVQEPSAFWQIDWSSYSNKAHYKSIRVLVDAGTGLPIELHVSDTDMSQWLPYDMDHLQTLAERFFGLLELEVQEPGLDGPGFVDGLDLCYPIAGTGLYCSVSRAPTHLSIQPGIDRRSGADATGYDS